MDNKTNVSNDAEMNLTTKRKEKSSNEESSPKKTKKKKQTFESNNEEFPQLLEKKNCCMIHAKGTRKQHQSESEQIDDKLVYETDPSTNSSEEEYE
ncbi:hypothetical protein QLX08_010201 [Tetragonisca angustula]|uniref:Uncharacterized protein n=1 Tax=Tetragonisca angustula TaxID=166442 RepID=A0AAW0ZCY9_9HYME